MKRRTSLFKLVTQMVFIDRTRQDGAKFKSSLEVGKLRLGFYRFGVLFRVKIGGLFRVK